jgi:lysophospholipase L1-like esterase
MQGMKVILFFVVALILVGVYYAYLVYSRIPVARELVKKALPFQLASDDHAVTLLVLGDSTGVGVGASSSADTVAALVAKEIGATYVENHAISGAAITDLSGQIAQVKLGEYSYVLIAIGGNDIIHFHDVIQAEKDFDASLSSLPKAGKVVVHSAGNVGGATLFPWFVRPFHTALNLKYHDMFQRVSARHGATYINLFTEKEHDPFLQHPEIYLAEDGLHPSSAGYALWFEKIRLSL